MPFGTKWRAEMLVHLSQTTIDTTATRNDGDDVQNFIASEDEIVARAVYTLDLILAAVGAPTARR